MIDLLSTTSPDRYFLKSESSLEVAFDPNSAFQIQQVSKFDRRYTRVADFDRFHVTETVGSVTSLEA